MKVKNFKEFINEFEQFVNESKVESDIEYLYTLFNNNRKHIGAFVKSGLVISIRPSGSLFVGGKKSEFAIKINPVSKTIQTWGKPDGRSSTSYVEIMSIIKRRLPKYKVEELSTNVELFNEGITQK